MRTGAFVIALFHLDPNEARDPSMVILSVYFLSILLATFVVLAGIRRWPAQPLMCPPRVWRYSLKSMLGLMTAVAVLTAMLTSVVKTVYDFPLFGSAMAAISAVVVWRFFDARRRFQLLRDDHKKNLRRAGD